jgi:oligopeptidase B
MPFRQRFAFVPFSLALVLSLLLGACVRDVARPGRTDTALVQTTTDQAPFAARKPHTVDSPNGNREDDWYWLRDDERKNPEILAYLKAENDWYAKYLAPHAALSDKVYAEIVGRIKQDDASVPYRERGYWYYTRYEEGKEYPIHARRKGSMQAPEQILLDGNAMAAGHDFFKIGNAAVSDNGRLLAYVTDTVGRLQWQLRVRDLDTGKDLPEAIQGLSESVAWASDNRTLFYVENDPKTLLTTRVKKHVLGTDPASDVLVYEEPDTSFYMGVERTGDHRYITITLGSTVSSETRFVRADRPNDTFRVLAPRERDHEYDADHIDSRWIIRSNWQAKNFRLLEVRDGREGDKKRWKEILAHRNDVFIEGFDPFRGFLAISERSDGLKRVRVRDWRGGNERYIGADEPAYVANIDINPEQRSDWLRYSYSSPTTPNTVYEINVKTGERKLLKRDPVLGGFDPANYVTERISAPARDGTQIPVTLLYRKGFQRDGSSSLLQYGYGSYGISMDPYFDSARLSLVDRGVVYAIAHIRGGQELGRAWYEDGKLLHKKNTFTDFIDVTRHLVAQGYAAKDKVAAMGGSAGGLLMGAVANMAPQDYRAIVAQVPFVDVVTTMLDESIPLTTNEFDEWGNPKQKPYYDYMLSYSPYDNVSAQAYPSLLVITGLWDSQVQYWEPAKWVSKLRATRTDANPLLFKINMEAGHGGKSGRFQRYRDTAESYTFLLDRFGIDK